MCRGIGWRLYPSTHLKINTASLLPVPLFGITDGMRHILLRYAPRTVNVGLGKFRMGKWIYPPLGILLIPVGMEYPIIFRLWNEGVTLLCLIMLMELECLINRPMNPP